jgi:hypothetical protein
MLIADIKNKLSLSELSSEDFLTSAVFSTFKRYNRRYNRGHNRGQSLNYELKLTSFVSIGK